MAVITERSLKRYLNRLIAIVPLREQSITGVGYDLTVGLCAFVDPRRKRVTDVRICDGTDVPQISLEPNSYLIVISREHVHLSGRLAATFHSKSSLASQAVYLNSTTGDPNWSGRLIFSLYNASGISVDLELDASFATMVIHSVSSRSKLRPKESKAVIEKYLKGLTVQEQDKIVGYVLKDDEDSIEFKRRARAVSRYEVLPLPLLNVWIRVVVLVKLLRVYWLPSLLFCLFFALLIPLFRPELIESFSARLGLAAGVATVVSAITSILALTAALVAATKLRDPVNAGQDR